MTRLYLLDAELFRDPLLFRRAREELSPRRREKIDALRRPEDRRRALAAGIALDRALAPWGLRERDVPQTLGPWGKPCLALPGAPEFSLSHSGGFALCAISPQAVGADAQVPRPVSQRLLSAVLDPGERSYLFSLPEEERQNAFFDFWCLKESVVKFWGIGLSFPLRRVPCRLDPRPTLLLPALPPPLLSLFPLPGCRLALCSTPAHPPAPPQFLTYP